MKYKKVLLEKVYGKLATKRILKNIQDSSKNKKQNEDMLSILNFYLIEIHNDYAKPKHKRKKTNKTLILL